MAVRASGVAAELRSRLPGIPHPTVHHLLYYCQGHHLAATGEPLFEETVSAWDQGPVVGYLWQLEATPPPPRVRPGFRTRFEPEPAPEPLAPEHLATVEAVVARYASLSPRDLRNLTRAEDPWRRADVGREPGGSARIAWSWLLDWFRVDDAAPLAAPASPDLVTASARPADPAEHVGSVKVDASDETVVHEWLGSAPTRLAPELAVARTSTPGSAA